MTEKNKLKLYDMEQQETFTLSLRYYNVVIQPAIFHEKENYVELFKRVFHDGHAIVTGTDKVTKMRSLDTLNDIMCGQLINYSTLSSKNWYDENADRVVEHDTAPNLYPNAREWDFYFSPDKHRMAVVVKRGISWSQFEKYFVKVFEHACEGLGFDQVVLNRVTTSQGLEEIFKLDSISSLEIEVSYSNNDNNDAYTTAIDDEFKESNVALMKAKAVGTKDHPIKLKKEGNSVLNSLLTLTKNNGFAKAKGRIGRFVKSINTRDFPQVSKLVKVDANSLLTRVKEAINDIID